MDRKKERIVSFWHIFKWLVIKTQSTEFLIDSDAHWCRSLLPLLFIVYYSTIYVTEFAIFLCFVACSDLCRSAVGAWQSNSIGRIVHDGRPAGSSIFSLPATTAADRHSVRLFLSATSTGLSIGGPFRRSRRAILLSRIRLVTSARIRVRRTPIESRMYPP